MNIIVTGEVQSGKTTWCMNYSHWLSGKGLTVSGILCTNVLNNSTKVGFDVLDLQSNKSAVFGRLSSIANFMGEPVGRYKISFKGLEYAESVIQSALKNKSDMIFLDEFGHLELAGKGIFNVAQKAYQSKLNTTTVVRKKLLLSFLDLFNRTDPTIKFIIKDIESDSAFLPPPKPGHTGSVGIVPAQHS